VKPDPDPTEFDAVAAAKELDDSLGDLGTDADASDDPFGSILENEIEQLTALVAQKDDQIRRANERADQAHAEIEAAQRRVATAAGKELELRTRKLFETFLPVVDNLDRAIAAAKAHAQVADLVAGIELVRRELLTSFATFGVKHWPSLGEPFDPNRHEALAVVPVTDPAQDGRVIDVMREGYVIGEDTLRPAGVAVGKRS
jgi:molecular chaperone GrpE